jgi:hypothetical protein
VRSNDSSLNLYLPFELYELWWAEGENRLFELWAVSPVTPAQAISFEAAAPDEAVKPLLWRIELPSASESATAQLAADEMKLKAVRNLLTDTLLQLESPLRAAESFNTTSTVGAELQAETRLLAQLTSVRDEEPALSFVVGDIVPAWKDAAGRLQLMIDCLLRHLEQYLLVETTVNGAPIGRTSVSWGADIRTVYRDSPDPSSVALHQRALMLALASKDMLAQMLIALLGGAAKLSVALSIGAPLLAIPVAWRLIEEMMKKADAYRQLNESIAID